MKSASCPRPLALVFLLASLVLPALQAAPASIAGSYESEGSTVQAASGYTGAVSLRALFALDFDFARNAGRHADIATVEVIQEVTAFTVRTLRSDHSVEWTAEWRRNGGFEATNDGVKLLLRAKRGSGQLYLFTLSTVNHDSALSVTIQEVVPDTFGPIGKEVGTFLFLRKAP